MKTLIHPRAKSIASGVFTTITAFALVFALTACAERETAEINVNTDTMATGTDTMMNDAAGAQFGTFNEWDADADTEITESEWNEGWADVDLFGEWDADADGFLTEEEWTSGTEEWNNVGWDWGTFGDWDTDANAELNEEEFGQGFYTVWDADDDQVLTQTEFRTGAQSMNQQMGAGGGIQGQGGMQNGLNDNGTGGEM